jgi:hypothetical protein
MIDFPKYIIAFQSSEGSHCRLRALGAGRLHSLAKREERHFLLSLFRAVPSSRFTFVANREQWYVRTKFR